MGFGIHPAHHTPDEEHHYYRQDSAPDNADGRLQVGDLWVDTTNSLLKRCTGLSPVTFASTEGGSASHDLFSATHGDVDEADTPADGEVLTYDSGSSKWVASAAGSGDVSAGANMTDNAVVRGDGGAKGVQDSGVLIDDSDNISAVTSLTFKGDTTLTISAGDVTVTNFYHTIAGEGGSADNLDGINGGGDGQILLIRPSSDSVTITVRHNQSAAAADNILLAGDQNYVMDDEDDMLFLVYDAGLDTNGAWGEVARGAGVVSLDGVETLSNKTLTTPTIGDFSNSGHDHSNAAGGGTVAHSDTTGQGTDDHHAQSHASAHADGGADEVAIQDLATDAATNGQIFTGDGSGGVTVQDNEAGIQFVIDGGGSAVSTGVKGYLELPFAGEITQVTLLLDQSSTTTIDIWKDTYANYPPVDADSITGGNEPATSATNKDQDATLTSWTTTFSKGDILGFNVDANDNATRITVSLLVKKT